MNTMIRSHLRTLVAALLLTGSATAALAHGDVVPQSVDTHTLPQLGAEWRSENPYAEGAPAHKEALRIGTSAYNQNCARCHGLEAISGGVAPDLRKIDADCSGMADPAMSTSRRRPYSSYFPSQTSSVRICDRGCGFPGPKLFSLAMLDLQ